MYCLHISKTSVQLQDQKPLLFFVCLCILQPIHDIIASALEKRNNDELSLALKVVGNAGHPSSLKPIMKLLPGFGSAASSLEHRVHVDAVMAMRKIAKREPKMVRQTFCPPYLTNLFLRFKHTVQMY